MSRRKGERRSSTARVADEMEPVEASRVRFPQDPVGLDVEAEPRRRTISGVDLEVLRDGVDAIAEHPEQAFVRRCRGQNAAGQQDDAIPVAHLRRGYAVAHARTRWLMPPRWRRLFVCARPT